MKPRWKKGSALLQTLVMSVLLSMIAISMMKWVLARYTMSARNYRSVATTSRVGGYTQAVFSYWNFGTGPSGMPSLPDGKSITYQTQAAGASTRVTMTSDEDL